MSEFTTKGEANVKCRFLSLNISPDKSAAGPPQRQDELLSGYIRDG